MSRCPIVIYALKPLPGDENSVFDNRHEFGSPVAHCHGMGHAFDPRELAAMWAKQGRVGPRGGLKPVPLVKTPKAPKVASAPVPKIPKVKAASHVGKPHVAAPHVKTPHVAAPHAGKPHEGHKEHESPGKALKAAVGKVAGSAAKTLAVTKAVSAKVAGTVTKGVGEATKGAVKGAIAGSGSAPAVQAFKPGHHFGLLHGYSYEFPGGQMG